jgi:hypothetical protein
MSRPRKCKICNGDPAITAQVNALLESCVTLKVIAEQIPEFSTFQLSRHKRNCLQSKITTDFADDGSTAIAKWMQRAEDLYLTAGANGDVRSQVAALSAAVRSIAARERQKEKERDSEPVDDPSALTIENIDKLVRQYAVRVEQERGKCLYCGSPKGREVPNELIAN